jgi:protein-disulfide isomerase
LYSKLKYLTIITGLAAMSLYAQSPAAGSTSPAASNSTSSSAITDPVVKQRIEQNLRARFRIPGTVSVEIGDRTPSEFAGYDQVIVTLVGQGHRSPNTFLLSRDGKTLAQVSKIDLSKDPFAPDSRPTRGAADAKVKVIVYDDFECPYCAKGYSTLFSDVYPEYKDKVQIVYKDFPLYEIHPWAIHAAVDANCLGAQNIDSYWAFADYVHENQAQVNGEKRSLPDSVATLDRLTHEYGQKNNLDLARLDACVKTQDETAVRDSVKYGEQTLGVEATPTLFINGTKVDGAVPGPELRKLLNAALEQAGVPLPAAEIKAASAGSSAKSGPEGKAVPDPAGDAVGVKPAPHADVIDEKPSPGKKNDAPKPADPKK